MVPRAADWGEAMTGGGSADKSGRVVFLTLLGVMVATLTVVGALVVKGLVFDGGDVEGVGDAREESAGQNSDITEVEDSVADASGSLPALPIRVDFQGAVGEWAANVGGEKSVLIYDLERGEVVGAYNVDADYLTASLYKLFVVYEGYRRVQSGEWNGDDPAGYTGYTIRECLDLAIRRSYSPCAETLWDYIGREELDEIIATDFGITGSEISRLVSNPGDIAAMMKIFYEHPEIVDEGLVSVMRDSFLNQPVTEYNWRQGLPSGFTRAFVYNKVGWDFNPDGGYWNLYHDAAIVDFPEYGRHYIVVVMSRFLPFQRIRELGSRIEDAFYGAVEASGADGAETNADESGASDAQEKSPSE